MTIYAAARPASTADLAGQSERSTRPSYVLMLLGGVLGIITAAWQTVERIEYAVQGSTESFCEINAVLSCSSVFDHWQSSALGIPNSLIALPVFTFIAAAGLAGLLGSQLSRGFLATTFGMTAFMTGFVTWYMQQTAFSIGVLCLFCVGCAVNILVAGVGVTRLASAAHVFGHGRADHQLRLLVESWSDVVIWLGVAALIAAMLLLGLDF